MSTFQKTKGSVTSSFPDSLPDFTEQDETYDAVTEDDTLAEARDANLWSAEIEAMTAAIGADGRGVPAGTNATGASPTCDVAGFDYTYQGTAKTFAAVTDQALTDGADNYIYVNPVTNAWGKNSGAWPSEPYIKIARWDDSGGSETFTDERDPALRIVGENRDDRYYTETELDAGQLDNRYYTETELDAGQLDNRYYTETELDAGQLDNRYYTETELDAGQLDNRYYTETELDAGQLDNRYFTESEHINTSAGAGDAGKPIKLDASGLVDSTMIGASGIDHGSLFGLGDDDHTVYTKADGTRAFSGNVDLGNNNITNLADPSAAQHASTKKWTEDNFYTETELDAGQLDNRYYTETELDAGQLDTRYFTESEHLNTSAGAGDAGKPIKLNADGLVDLTMLSGHGEGDFYAELSKQATTTLRLEGKSYTPRHVTVNGEEIDVSTAIDCTVGGSADNTIAADGTDSGSTPTASTIHHAYQANNDITIASGLRGKLRVSLTAPNANGYLGTSGAAAHWRWVGAVYLDGSKEIANDYNVAGINQENIDRITLGAPISDAGGSSQWSTMFDCQEVVFLPGMVLEINLQSKQSKSAVDDVSQRISINAVTKSTTEEDDAGASVTLFSQYSEKKAAIEALDVLAEYYHTTGGTTTVTDTADYTYLEIKRKRRI